LLAGRPAGLPCGWPNGVRFQPCLFKGISHVELRNVNYRKMNFDVTIRGTGAKVKQYLIDGQEVKDGLLLALLATTRWQLV
jgi:hypothetical protein